MKIFSETLFICIFATLGYANAFSPLNSRAGYVPKNKIGHINRQFQIPVHSFCPSSSKALKQSIKNDVECGKSSNRRVAYTEKAKALGGLILDRTDTLRTAGFYEDTVLTDVEGKIRNRGDSNDNAPLQAGFKLNATMFFMALCYKWYRSIFINKLAIWERQPQWNTVITSKEEEEKANLEAMTCNNCGSTVFIAKGRKWFQMPKDYTCYCCGTKGIENFTNTREDLLEDLDDDYFDYEKPLDFVTRAERRKLMKQAGGSEEMANQLLTQGSTDQSTEGEAKVDESSTTKKKKKKKKGKKKKKKKDEDSVQSVETKGEVDIPEIADVPDGDSQAIESKDDKPKDDDLDVLDMDGF